VVAALLAPQVTAAEAAVGRTTVEQIKIVLFGRPEAAREATEM